MKPSDIKFDLPFNGTKLCRLDDLKNNLTAELLEPFRTGKLARWLRVRKLVELADNVEALLAAEIAANNQREVQSLKGLMELFDGETDENLLRAAIAERKKTLPSSVQNSDDEVEQLKAENEVLKSRIEELEHAEFLTCFVSLTLSLKKCIEDIVNILKINFPIIEAEFIYSFDEDDIKKMKKNLNNSIVSVNKVCELETNKVASKKISFKHIETI